jgi:hypothetical protein
MSGCEQLPRRKFLGKTTRLGAVAAALATGPGGWCRGAAGQQAEAVSPATAPHPLGTYATINAQSWETIVADDRRRYSPPLSVHVPIQPVHSRDWIHVDCALNVCRRRVFPAPVDSPSLRAAQEHETFIVQFALGEPPLIPAASLSRLSLAEGKYPLTRAEYRLGDLLYEFEYFCCPIDQRQNLLWVCCAATNQGAHSKQAQVWAKVNFQRECDLFHYHYEPFRWDSTKWKPSGKVRLKDQALWREATAIGKVVPGDFSIRWEAAASFTEEQFRQALAGGPALHQQPSLWLRSVDDVLHFSTALAPRERKTLAIAMLTDFEAVTTAHRSSLAAAQPVDGRAQAQRHFQSQLTDAQLICPADDWGKIFTALQLSTLQLLVNLPDRQDLVPTQGGSSERHYVWVWEATMMLWPMLRLGHFRPVRQVLDFLSACQDAGFPPSGRLASTAGAIGTPGTRWLNQTGAALALAAEYCQLAHDEEYQRESLPKIAKAVAWIVGEVRASRKLNPDGSRPPYYGLMPFGCGTDGDVGYVVTITDAYTFWGLERAVLLLEQTRYPGAAEFRQALESYRSDLTRAIDGLTRPDGYIERQIVADKDQKTHPPFDNTTNAVHLAFTGNLDLRSERFRRFVDYVEQQKMDGYFTGKMSPEMFYLGVGEFAWHHAYLRLGEYKKAFAALRTNLRYGMTQDTYQVQERLSGRDPAFTPWQPNGSGNGRTLEMMLNAVYFEHDGVVTLLGGIPLPWLIRNGLTALRNLHTRHGRVSLEAQSGDGSTCELRLSLVSGEHLPPVLRLPSHFTIERDPAVATIEPGNLVRLRDKPRQLKLLLRPSPAQ